MFAGLRNVLLLLVCLLCATGHAWAVALGKIDVASHLGETFYAEVPIQLDADEKVSDVSVELASPSDYQILEVFRDSALNKLSVQLKNDKRGPRAVITSTDAVNTAYFNLVLKLRYGHATNFKKYPIFLDLPKQMQPPVVSAPSAEQPSVNAVSQPPAASVASTMAASPVGQSGSAQPASGFTPYAGWARIGRYGPMVRGDTISTVAERLRVDDRYTLNQVMVALFDKNKSKFRADNINLIDAGSYLDVPTAAEVASVSNDQARRILREQNKRWQALKKQPVYAAEAEAQKNRYRTRVSIGETASGTAAAPVASAKAQARAAMPETAQQKEPASPQQKAQESKMAAQLQELQQENLKLKQALQASKATAGTAQQPETADAAAAEAHAKKLQLSVVRLQQQILRVNQQLREMQTKSNNAQLLTYVLGGVIVLLIAVSGYLLFLLRRVRPHPAETLVAEGGPAAGSGEIDENEIDSVLDSLGELHQKMSEASTEPALQPESFERAAANAGHRLEEAEPEPAAGIDYLAEAEVYLRYGMEDEALQQINRAIMESPDSLKAHTKLIELLLTLGDASAVMAAIDTARGKLGEEDLPAFEAFVSSALSKEQEAASDATGEFEPLHDDAESAHDDAEEEDFVSGLHARMEEDAAQGEPERHEEAEDSGIAMSFETTADREANVAGTDDEEGEAELEASEGLEFILGKDRTADTPSEDADEDIAPWKQSGDHEADDHAGLVFGDDEADGAEVQVADDLESILGMEKATDTHADETTEKPMAWKPDDEPGLAFELPDESLMETGALKKDADSADETSGLMFELPDERLEEQGDEFEPAGKEVTPYLTDADEEDVPETTLDAEPSGDALGEILNEFDGLAGNADVESETDGEASAADDSTDLSHVAALPETDVSHELDDILAEWDKRHEEIAVDAGPENLAVDRARSLLAEGQLDEAEQALQSAMDGDRKADALIGLAEAAAMRGDDARKAELLAEAEPLVDAGNRDWFDSVKNLSS